MRRIEFEAEASQAVAADHGAEILIVVKCAEDATVALLSDKRSLQLKRGGICFAAHGTPYIIETSGKATLYKATVPS